MFIRTLIEDPFLASWWLLVVVFSICLHEYGHALMAKLQGDTTAEEMGHLTLNPLKQMGVTSLITLFLIGFAWGAVPVNPARMKHRYSRTLVALAGVSMNLLLFLLFVIATVFCIKFLNSESAAGLMSLGALLNIMLMMFNLLPIPPLDGFTALTSAFPSLGERLARSAGKESYAGITLFLFVGTLMLGMKYLVAVAQFLTELAIGGLLMILGGGA